MPTRYHVCIISHNSNEGQDAPLRVEMGHPKSKGGKQMSTQVAYVVAGVMIFVGAIVGGGIIYAGLQKVADAINKQK